MAINLSGSIKNALGGPKTFLAERDGQLDEVNLLIDTTLAWHFHKQLNVAADREQFILEYFSKRYKDCNGVAKANINRLASFAGQKMAIKNETTGGMTELPMMSFKFDMLFSFVVGVDYASPDAYQFKKEFVEETLATINKK